MIDPRRSVIVHRVRCSRRVEVLGAVFKKIEDYHDTAITDCVECRYVAQTLFFLAHHLCRESITLRCTVVAIAIAGLDVNILSLSSTVPAPGVSGPYTGNIVVWSLSLATNMLTTAMVAFKSW